MAIRVCLEANYQNQITKSKLSHTSRSTLRIEEHITKLSTRELKIFICYSYGYSTKTNDVIYLALNKHGLHSIKNTCEQ